MKHGGIQPGVVAVCQASEGVSLEVPSRFPEGLEHDSIDRPLCLGRTLQTQESRKPSHPIRLGQYKDTLETRETSGNRSLQNASG